MDDQAYVHYPGFGLCGTAETIITALHARSDLRDLTGVSNNAGDGIAGLAPLVKTGQITKMILSYVGTNKNLQDTYLRGDVALELSPQGTIAERLRAAAAGMPGFYTRTGAGANLPRGHVPVLIHVHFRDADRDWRYASAVVSERSEWQADGLGGRE